MALLHDLKSGWRDRVMREAAFKGFEMSENKLAGFGVTFFAAIGFVIIGFLSLQIREGFGRQADKSNRYIVRAIFKNVGGLKVGAPVKLAGVRVGHVAAIQLEASPGYKVVVELALEDRFASIPSDSDATVQTASLLGGNFITVTPGGSETPLVEGGEIHSSNSAFSLERLVEPLR